MTVSQKTYIFFFGGGGRGVERGLEMEQRVAIKSQCRIGGIKRTADSILVPSANDSMFFKQFCVYVNLPHVPGGLSFLRVAR
jgi:hypothetical protein